MLSCDRFFANGASVPAIQLFTSEASAMVTSPLDSPSLAAASASSLTTDLHSSSSFTQTQLNEQSILSLNWFQRSGEYAATAYQAYNAATIAFDQAVAGGAINPAVVMDLDETVFDNSAYDAGLVDTNNVFNNSTWYQWIKAEQATAIPGSVDFINHVNSSGGRCCMNSSICFSICSA